jgi:DNA helicase-2/ATP-dependent DNA helicase PcrA
VDALARADSFLPGRMGAKAKAFHDCLRSAGEMRGTARLDEIALRIVELIGYIGYLENEFADSAEERMDNVNELITAMGDFVNETDEDDLASFLAEVSLVADVDTWDDRSDAVTLMTLHSAKGLEFPTVCIAGVEKGLFPLPATFESEAELEEERRLFYVGITRARERLHISYACQRFRYGSFSGGASMFIAEIPPEVVEFEASEPQHAVSSGKTAGKTVKQKSRIITFEDYSQEAPDHTESGFFSVGAFVLHPKFGRGQIMEVSGTGDNLMLTVLFGTQKKKILPKYANLVPA